MPNPTYTLISSNTLGSAAASVSFTSIPNIYTNLIIRCSARRSASGLTDLTFYLNSDSATNAYTYMQSSGSAATGGNVTSSSIKSLNTVPSTAETASTFGSIEITIPFKNSTAANAVGVFGVGENNGATGYVNNAAGLRVTGTGTISSVTINPGAGSFDTGSSFYLYGLTQA